MLNRLTAIGPATQLAVDGYASFEGHDDPPDIERNRALSERRQSATVTMLRDLGYTNVVAGAVHGHTHARDRLPIAAGGPTPGPGDVWLVARQGPPRPPPPRPRSAQPRSGGARPTRRPPSTRSRRPPAVRTVFRKIGVRVELVRSTFIRGEIYGEFDIETAAEQSLRPQRPACAAAAAPATRSTGSACFLLRLRLSEDRGAWEVTAEFRALDADLDGLAKMDQAHANQVRARHRWAPSASWRRSVFGRRQALPGGGRASWRSAAIALGASEPHPHPQADPPRRRAEGQRRHRRRGRHAPRSPTAEPQLSVLLDLEIAFSFDLGIVRVDPAHPVTTRYKAIGVRS